MDNAQTEMMPLVDWMKTKEHCWLPKVVLPWSTNITALETNACQSVTMQML